MIDKSILEKLNNIKIDVRDKSILKRLCYLINPEDNAGYEIHKDPREAGFIFLYKCDSKLDIRYLNKSEEDFRYFKGTKDKEVTIEYIENLFKEKLVDFIEGIPEQVNILVNKKKINLVY